MPLKSNKENITSEVSNYGNSKKTRPTNIGNNKKDIKPADIDKQKLATLNLIPWIKLLSELSSTFKEVTFSESEFLAGILVFDTQYKYPWSQNNNLFYLFNN